MNQNSRNPLIQIAQLGQSLWLDNLARPMIQDGLLARLVEEDGLSGITSNPTIFHKAITSHDVYDSQIHELAAKGKSALEIYETLAIQDIQGATDVLRPVFERSGGTDGFVSLEVSPHLARDTRGTVDEAVRLWNQVDRPNLLIKIPGTDEGIPAIETCLARGININITLLFSLKAYRKVMDAYFRALEARLEKGKSIKSIASVASFFLSRIDVKVDKILDGMISAGNRIGEARALRGRAAIANAKLAYQLWKEKFATDRWKKLEEAEGRIQKPLWASTSTKDPDESDVKYVEALIGPHTVNTLPEETVDAVRDHGKAAATVEVGVEEARRVMVRLAAIGINMSKVTDELVVEGVTKFVKPFDALLDSLEAKRKVLAAAGG